jgi:uncharacterized protein YbcI
MVHLHKQYYGKGPVKAKTYFVDDACVCMLEGGFTVVERTLIDDGQHEQVESMRRAFERSMSDRFRGAIEELTGRSVLAYLSQVHTNPDLAIELFVLEPREIEIVDKHEAEFGDEEDA